MYSEVLWYSCYAPFSRIQKLDGFPWTLCIPKVCGIHVIYRFCHFKCSPLTMHMCILKLCVIQVMHRFRGFKKNYPYNIRPICIRTFCGIHAMHHIREFKNFPWTICILKLWGIHAIHRFRGFNIFP